MTRWPDPSRVRPARAVPLAGIGPLPPGRSAWPPVAAGRRTSVREWRNLSALDEDSRGATAADVVVEPVEDPSDRLVVRAEHVVAPDALELAAALEHLMHRLPQAVQVQV